MIFFDSPFLLKSARILTVPEETAEVIYLFYADNLIYRNWKGVKV